jgi:hypothetical protein
VVVLTVPPQPGLPADFQGDFTHWLCTQMNIIYIRISSAGSHTDHWWRCSHRVQAGIPEYPILRRTSQGMLFKSWYWSNRELRNQCWSALLFCYFAILLVLVQYQSTFEHTPPCLGILGTSWKFSDQPSPVIYVVPFQAFIPAWSWNWVWGSSPYVYTNLLTCTYFYTHTHPHTHTHIHTYEVNN